MRWTDRQHALLAEMGIRLWPTESAEPAEPLMLAEPPVAPETPAARPVTSSPQPAESAVRPPAPSRSVPLAPASMPRPLAESLPVHVSVAEPGQTDPARSVSEMDWDELESTVAACRLCGLCEGRRQTVFGVGNRQAQWMLVGEAPGEQEDLRGEPFVGKAGQLLDNMLRAVGLTREVAEPQRQVYIANVLKCRPPQNRNPEPLEVQRCEPYLKRQVELVRPRLILAMGRFAVQSLLQTTEPIGRLRGKQHSYHGVPVVVTYHPAYLLRNPLDKARAWEDLCLARELMQAAG